jgi:hypothetical protein
MVDSAEQWQSLLRVYKLEKVLAAMMAPIGDIINLPPMYFVGSPGVHSGKIPSFGFRREHQGGMVTLEQWASGKGMDLRALANETKED